MRLCVDVMSASHTALSELLAEGAGSAVKFDAGLGSAAPRRREFPLAGLTGRP